MQKLLMTLLLLFSLELHLDGMTTSQTNPAGTRETSHETSHEIFIDINPDYITPESRSTLPRCLQKIMCSKRVGRFCAWLFSPILALSHEDLSYLHQNTRTPASLNGLVQDRLIKFTEVNSTTSTGIKQIKQGVAVIAVVCIFLFCLPTASAKTNVWENLEDHLKPNICVEQDQDQRCCTIENDMSVSCCVTSLETSAPVCKSYDFTMPARVSAPFGDISKLKNQCSADLTDETLMIRKEINNLYKNSRMYIEIPESGTMLSKKMKSAPPYFLKKFTTALKNIGISADAPLVIVFMRSEPTSDLLDAAIYPARLKLETYYSGRYQDGGLATLHIRSNLLDFFSVDEIFATINHELGHLVHTLRDFAQVIFSEPSQAYNREVFADLISGLLSNPDADQMSMRRQYALSSETCDQNNCATDCNILNRSGHPPLLCRIAYLDKIQGQLGE